MSLNTTSSRFADPIAIVRGLCLATFICVSHLPSAFGQREVVISDSFSPAFQIEPLVQRISGRRGDVLDFSFKIETLNRDTEIEVLKVGLRQELSGQVFQDERAGEMNPIEILTPGKLTLSRDIPHMIHGIVKVPDGDASLYSLGVLVRDNGAKTDRQPEFDSSGKQVTKAGITFITHYILRVDVDVIGAKGDQARELTIEEGRIYAFNGLPKVSVIVQNTTDTAFEYELRAQLRAHPSDRSFSELRLAMPIRASMEGEERFLGRVLPKCAVRMEAMLPELLLSGRYQLDVEMLDAGRVINRHSFPVTVNSEDFPAQEVKAKHISDGVYVSPTQVELSQTRGGQRRLALEIRNSSNQSRTVTLGATNARGTQLSGLLIQPESFTLSAGRSRKLSLTLRTKTDVTEAIEFGTLTIDTRGPDQQLVHSGTIPIALILTPPPPPKVDMQPLRWVADPKYPSFRAEVRNDGEVHLPLEARLMIISSNGQRKILAGGFGKWLMPGETANLEFRLDAPLPTGQYQMVCELQTGQTPIIKKQQISVSDFENARPASTRGRSD